MRFTLILLLAICCFWSCQETTKKTAQLEKNVQNPVMKVNYPQTKTVEHVDKYHDTEISDPYRWLEDDTAEEVEAWVKGQNEVTFDYLSKIPYRENIRKRYEELFNFPKLSSPFKAGDYYFFYISIPTPFQKMVLRPLA